MSYAKRLYVRSISKKMFFSVMNMCPRHITALFHSRPFRWAMLYEWAYVLIETKIYAVLTKLLIIISGEGEYLWRLICFRQVLDSQQLPL